MDKVPFDVCGPMVIQIQKNLSEMHVRIWSLPNGTVFVSSRNSTRCYVRATDTKQLLEVQEGQEEHKS